MKKLILKEFIQQRFCYVGRQLPSLGTKKIITKHQTIVFITEICFVKKSNSDSFSVPLNLHLVLKQLDPQLNHQNLFTFILYGFNGI